MIRRYRVRSQKQWNWLMNKLEKQGVKWWQSEHILLSDVNCPPLLDNDIIIILNDELMAWSQASLTTTKHDLIEVSTLMEESKMENYVTIEKSNFVGVNFIEDGCVLGGHNKISDIEELRISKTLIYPKVPMTEVEKMEFDKLPRGLTLVELFKEIRDAFNSIDGDGVVYPTLKAKLYNSCKVKAAQEAMALAYLHPELIEVIPDKKYFVRVPIKGPTTYYFEKAGNVLAIDDAENKVVHPQSMSFTQDEIVKFGLGECEKLEVQND